MKAQTSIIFAIIFALLVAIFAVINVDAVPVNFLFFTREAPLILVILISVLMGSVMTAAFGFVKIYRLQRTLKQLKQEHHQNDPNHENREIALENEDITKDETNESDTSKR
ncbi:Uncharacterized integral membrane protein [Salinibacillus kushneri]|uniref:Uncharacterized integral membrane protein n=1 Tax=Salinibacillus kushneri TaxID=237682 RepID=A0A1I0GAA9_9BACI|nr:lipopolysaccharide assembly protein LapA domain-containing protein [Salinibacillus kushneri]SET67027.1 Uncharacterized integral membrane protein [Salinibacillus kushneri]